MLLGKRLCRDSRKIPVGIALIAAVLLVYHFGFSSASEEATRLRFRSAQSLVTEPKLNRPGLESASETDEPTSPSLDYAINNAQKRLGEHQAFPAVPAIPAASRAASLTRKKPLYRVEELRAVDLVLLFDTTASSLWQRLPVHLVTSLTPERISPENILIYSDSVAEIGHWNVINIFENITTTTAKSERARKIDKYRFLPLLQHAGHTKPRAKWYVYVQDDSYVFLPNLLRHLSTLNSKDAWYIGDRASKYGDEYAHGGAGFALSRGAWEQSFGKEDNMLARFADFADAHVSGDHILGHVLKEYGVLFAGTDDRDRQLSVGFNPESHYVSAFSRENWCMPVYSWHRTEGEDIARFYALEQSWDFNKRTLQYRDIYTFLIAPAIHGRIEQWDNHANQYEITSATASDIVIPRDVESPTVWRHSWQSVDACETACMSWRACVQWSFVEDRCRLDQVVVLGGSVDQPTETMTSGWLSERLDHWVC